MTVFINSRGERVDVVRNADGSFTVTGEDGGSTQYGADDAGGNLARDWSLDGTDFSPDKVGSSGSSGSDDDQNDNDSDSHDDTSDHDHDDGHDHDDDHDTDPTVGLFH